jgi:hypothetical protein
VPILGTSRNEKRLNRIALVKTPGKRYGLFRKISRWIYPSAILRVAIPKTFDSACWIRRLSIQKIGMFFSLSVRGSLIEAAIIVEAVKRDGTIK